MAGYTPTFCLLGIAMKVLLVEDDRPTRDLLAYHLTAARYTIEQAADGVTGLELATLLTYDLMVLDVQIPRLDGISLCRKLRNQGITTPILILTAYGSEDSIITGLDAGADDYVTKPFEVSQVLARIRALLRRGDRGQGVPSLVWGDLCLDPALAEVTYQGRTVPVTPKEYSLLELFLRHPQQVLSRSTILDHLWTLDDSPTEGAVTNLVKDLRNQLKRSGMTESVIQTVYGLGYRLKDLPATPQPSSSSQPDGSTPVSHAPSPAAPEDIHQGADPSNTVAQIGELKAIAARFQASIRQRLMVVEDAIRVLQAGVLNPQQQTIACEEAHRLAGGLGTFGYNTGSMLARRIEQLLQQNQPLDSSAIDALSATLLKLKQTLAAPPQSLTRAEPLTGTGAAHQLVTLAVAPSLVEQLGQSAPNQHWQVTALDNLDGLDQVMARVPIDAIVIDLHGSVPAGEAFGFLRTIKQRDPEIPVLVLSSNDCLAERVQVARLGGDRYLVTPATAAQVLDSLEPLLPSSCPISQSQVMVVDNDPMTCAAVTNLLTPWGLEVVELNHPTQFWTALHQTQPNLLLLSMEMPTFSGTDLCRVVRQDPRFGHLPILMMAAHPDTVTIHQVFEVGGDDLIGKPIIGPELVTRVLSRLERNHLRQPLACIRQPQAMFWPQFALHRVAHAPT
ncbi:response regulator [Nodosilinea sp. P-1105]|nr:response regulator [Nodosilinea sp. P-1105]